MVKKKSTKKRKGETQAEYELRVFGRRFGRIPSKPDPTAPLYSQHPEYLAATKRKLAASVDLQAYDSPVQYQIGGTCTAYASVAAFEWYQNYTRSAYFDGSELFVYHFGKVLAGDNGAIAGNVVANMAQHGVCHESLWPMDISKVDTAPNQTAVNDAAQNVVTHYWRVDSGTGQNILNQTKIALSNNHPVILGISVYDNSPVWPDSTGYMWPEGNSVWRGGHEMLAVGYSDSGGWVKCKNSYGTDWGDNGYCYVVYQNFTHAEPTESSGYSISDCWVIDNATLAPLGPSPPPEPQPPEPQPLPVNTAQQLYYTPQNSMTWINKGAAAGYNATVGGSNRYGIGSTGYPYWGNFTQNDYVCIPSGTATNNQNTVSWEIGFRFVGQTGRRFEKIWDKAYGAYIIEIDDTFHALTLYRATAGGGARYFSPLTTPIYPGHNYYIQISWAAGTNASCPYPTIYIGVDNAAPVLQTTYDPDTGSGSGAWYNDAVGAANICNCSADAGCPSSIKDYWLGGNLYVFRQYNTIQDFSGPSHGMWYSDKHRWVAPDSEKSTVFDSFPSSGYTITNTGSSGAEYYGTAHYQDYAALGAYTQWTFQNTDDYIWIHKGPYLADHDHWAFEFAFRYDGPGSSNMGTLASKRTSILGGEFCIWVDSVNQCITLERVTTNSDWDGWHTPYSGLTYDNWYEVQIGWNCGTGPATVPPYEAPHIYINGVEQGLTHYKAGTGDWDYDGNYSLVFGQRDAALGLDVGLEGSLAIVRWWNVYKDGTILLSHYNSDKARFITPEVIQYKSSTETSVLYLIEVAGTGIKIGAAEAFTLNLLDVSGTQTTTPSLTSVETPTLALTDVSSISTAISSSEIIIPLYAETSYTINSSDETATLVGPTEWTIADQTLIASPYTEIKYVTIYEISKLEIGEIPELSEAAGGAEEAETDTMTPDEAVVPEVLEGEVI